MQCRSLFYKTLFYFLSLLSLTVEAVTSNSELVGSTKGTFSVTPSGSASYSIPIQLPPNVGGVQPTLALSYDSSGGNGLLGQGWALSGLSAIARCPTTLERDGFIDGVDFDSNDQFCLDGQRLVHISGSLYRSELDDFSVINGGLNGFTIQTASGLTMSYGTSSNARIQLKGQSGKVMTWALNEVKDAYGNRYTISYTNNGYSSGEYYASRIYMYGRQNLLSHVALVYEPRPDVISGYQAGSKYQLTKRLSAVKTYSKNSLTKQYQLHFADAVEPLNTSYIESIEECDSLGYCLEPLTLNYEDTESYQLTNTSFDSYVSADNLWGGADWKGFSDFNNDGISDLWYVKAGSSEIWVRLGGVTGLGAATKWAYGNNWASSEWKGFEDFDGNGCSDLWYTPSGTSKVYVRLSNCLNGFNYPVLWADNNPWGGAAWKGFDDIDGNGYLDLWYVQGGTSKVYVRLNTTGNGFNTATLWADGNNWADSDWKGFSDFNADGLPDLWYVQSGTSTVSVRLNNGINKFNAATSWASGNSWAGAEWKGFNDINGDGAVDLWYVPSGSSSIYVRLSNGLNQFQPASLWAESNPWGGAVWKGFIDLNGDGWLDFWYVKSGTTQVYFRINNGSGFEIAELLVSLPSLGGADWVGFEDFDGNGYYDLWYVWGGTSKVRIRLSEGNSGRRIAQFKSFRDDTKLLFKPLTSSSVYSKDTAKNASHRIRQLQNSIHTVSQITQPDGVGGSTTTSYKYEGLRYDLYAKRPLGFAKTIIENPKTDIRSETSYNQNYPYIGMVTSTKTTLMSSGQLLSTSAQSGFAKRDTSGKKTYFTYATEQSETTYLLNDNLIEVGSKSVKTESTFNTSGQLTNQLITSTGSDGAGSFSVETSNEYSNGYSSRRQGEITRATVTSRAPGQTALTRTSSFDYDWSKGHLVKEVIEPGHADPSISRVSVYAYDSFGNRTSTVICDGRYEYSCSTSANGARFSTVQFSSDGLFATSATNALGYTSYSTYDARFGVVTSSTDINGLTSTFTFDTLGRKLTSKNPFNQTATTTRAWCDYTCPSVGGNEAYYKITTQALNTPTSVVYFDQFNREIRKQTEGFNAEIILVDTEYDDFGRVKRTSEPYFQGDTPYWNTPVYDALSRKRHVISPNQDGSYDTSSSISYQGFTTEITDALGRTVTEVKNVLGKVVKMTDKAQNDTLYEYDALGNLTKTTDVAGNQVILSYDIRGRKTQMIDPDMGTWKYKYNTFDQLVEQTDAKNQKTVMVYDTLGRMTSRTDASGTSGAQTASWSYYTTPLKSRGKLYQKVSANGDYTRYTYNTIYGQLIQTDQRIGSKIFSVRNTYDSLGRVNSITYPATTAYSSGLKVLRQYNAKGFLNLVRKHDGSVNYWRADALSPRGQLEAATYGNGTQELSAHSDANGWLIASQVYKGNSDLFDMTYEFDAVGNIVKRNDALQNNMTEEFGYDELDRLKRSTIYGGPSGVSHADKLYSYDDMGNITSKSDVGSYSYTSCGGRPHAVCNAGGTVYTYDANGSMIKGVKGSTTTQVGYTAFDKANYMQKGNYAVTFNYDAGRNRNYKSRIQNGSLNLQTYYVGTSGNGAKIFEQEVSSATGTKNIHYIYGAGGQAVATHITEGTAKRTEYMHRDHLGSVALVTNDAGQVVSPASFDAFGKRRNSNWSDNATGSGLSDITGNIGFTGQETIKEIGLIHMNGRIYDPNLGRFLSADPLIQAPYNSQSYNRYSYVMNNPLSLLDPSGYSWVSKKWKSVKKFAKKNWSAVKFVATAYMFGPNAAILTNKSTRNYIKTHKWSQQVMSVGAGIADALGCLGACSSANSAYLTELNGGNFNDMLKSAALAYASYAAFSAVNAQYGDAWNTGRVIDNGLVGGAMAKLGGGKFADGFNISAGLAAIRMGWEYTKGVTNGYKLTACSQGFSSCKYNDAGELLTDGGRGEIQYPGTNSGNGNFITNGGMALEGSGRHLYQENSLIGRFVNHVSKSHDWLNSDLSKAFGFRGYDQVTGMWFAGNEAYNTAFQVYSFAGMLPAATFTSLAMIQPLSGTIIQERNRPL